MRVSESGDDFTVTLTMPEHKKLMGARQIMRKIARVTGDEDAHAASAAIEKLLESYTPPVKSVTK